VANKARDTEFFFITEGRRLTFLKINFVFNALNNCKKKTLKNVK